MSTLGASSIASVTTASYCRTNYTIFELSSVIDEDIATEYALDIYGNGWYIDVEGYDFELHINVNEI